MSLMTKTFSFKGPTGVFSHCRTINIYLSIRNFAARKGTREKARKKKVKVEEKKVGFIPHNLRGADKALLNRISKKVDDSWKQIATDNVYPTKYYRWKVYPFAEAVQCHRETHHPTMYNEPNAPLNVILELNMEAEKKNRFIDNFVRVAAIPHAFDHGEERNVLVFSKDAKMQEDAQNAGATLAGGPELVKEIQTGALSLQDFHYVLAHPNILPELVSLRGLMKKKFPNPRNGTLGPELVEMVQKFVNGINYSAKKDEYEKDFGLIETTVGPLSMEIPHLEDNFKALINDVYSVKPRRSGIFIRRCLLVSPPCSEKLKVDYESYLQADDDREENEEDNEVEQRATA